MSGRLELEGLELEVRGGLTGLLLECCELLGPFGRLELGGLSLGRPFGGLELGPGGVFMTFLKNLEI